MAWHTGQSLKGIKSLIRKQREALWIHQSVMADMLGVHQSTYAKMETTNAGITEDRLVKICDRLRITPEEAFEAIRKSQGEHAK